MKKMDDNPLYAYTLHLHLTLQSSFTPEDGFGVFDMRPRNLVEYIFTLWKTNGRNGR